MSKMMKISLLLTVQCFIGFVMTQTCTWKRASSCYNVVDTDAKDFVSADSDCQATFGGHLVSINDEDEQMFLATKLVENYGCGRNREVFWTGGIYRDGNWQWVSGEAMDYTYWWDGHPAANPSDNRFVILYAYTALGYGYKWWDDDNTYPYKYICESQN